VIRGSYDNQHPCSNVLSRFFEIAAERHCDIMLYLCANLALQILGPVVLTVFVENRLEKIWDLK
jgi:hypothetical protein